MKARNVCLFCNSRSCHTAIFTEDRSYDEVACSCHIKELEKHSDKVLGNPGKLRTHLTSSEKLKREGKKQPPTR